MGKQIKIQLLFWTMLNFISTVYLGRGFAFITNLFYTMHNVYACGGNLAFFLNHPLLQTPFSNSVTVYSVCLQAVVFSFMKTAEFYVDPHSVLQGKKRKKGILSLQIYLF